MPRPAPTRSTKPEARVRQSASRSAAAPSSSPARLVELEDLIANLDPANARDAAPLRSVAVAAQVSRDADDALAVAVANARSAGTSWTAIGAVLGVSRQAAQQRFGS